MKIKPSDIEKNWENDLVKRGILGNKTLKEEKCLGCNTLPFDNPFHICKEKPPKIEELVEYDGIWYKKGKGNRCDKFTMVDLRELLAQEKQQCRQEILGKQKTEIMKVKQDKRFVYYQCCDNFIGIAKKFPKGIHIGNILCGKCGRRIY